MQRKIWGIIVVSLVIMLAGCSVVYFRRTLAEYIRSVYIPMATNNSYEPGLEELLTQLTTDEFLADGRLRVENKAHADITVRITIDKFENTPRSFYSDDFAGTSRLKASTTIEVINNLNGKTMGIFKDVSASYNYVSDPRRTVYEIEPEAKEELLRTLAKNIVREVLTGKYEPEP